MEDKTIKDKAGASQIAPEGFVEDNKLHKYASYNYVFTLSALSRAELQDPNQILKNAPHDIIARTGGIGDSRKFSSPNDGIFTTETGDAGQAETIAKQDKFFTEKAEFAKGILKKNRDIYFQKVEIDSRPWFNQQRKLMNFTSIEMSLTEPTGISLWQKIRAAAANNAFVNHLNAPFLLTLEFKGYKSNGEQVTDASLSRRLPITLTKSNMQLNAGGATYNLTAVPFTDFAKNNAFLYTRGSGEIKGSGARLDTYLTNFADSLNKNMQQEVENDIREYPDTYRITADASIGEIGTADYENLYQATAMRLKQLKSATYKSNQSISKILEDFVKQFPKYSNISRLVETYWKDVSFANSSDYDRAPTPWVPWFKIASTVTVHKEFDKRLKSHRRTIHFHIKPFSIHVANFARAGLGGFASWSETVRKVYNYIYTGKNLDILDLDIDYNSSYALSTLVVSNPVNFAKKLTNTFKKVLRYFGNDDFPELDLPVQEHPTASRTTSDSVTDLEKGQAQVQEFYDFLTDPQGDMVVIDMRIMGDPAFIGQDLFLPLPTPDESGFYNAVSRVGTIKGFDWDAQIGAFNFDSAEVGVRLDFVFPSDFDENKGLYTFSQGETPQFSGLYRVNGVRSVFENGQFTQNLTMSRHMNQHKTGDAFRYTHDKQGNTIVKAKVITNETPTIENTVA